MRKSNKFTARFFLPTLMVMLLPVLVGAQERTSQKLAQTGMKFLNVGMSARQAALADAFTAAEGNSVSMFYNPAGMARLSGFADVSIGQVNWLADIKHTFATVAISPWSGDYGVLGVSFQYIDYGEIQATILASNKQGYLDVGTFKPYASAVGLTYARALTERFSIGGSVKLVKQDLGTAITQIVYTKDITGTPNGTADAGKVEVKSSLDVPAFDLGVMYKTGFRSLALGMTVRNFAREVSYQSERFQLPLTFRLGASMNMFELLNVERETQSLLLSVDAEHPRDFPEQVKVGVEYVFMNMIAGRVGYVSPADEHNFSYGVGFQYALGGTQFHFDYAYTPFGVFNNVQRFSLQFAF